VAGGIEFGSLTDLFTSKALAADGDALLTEHRGHPGFGDAAASTDLLRRVSGLVFLHDVGDIIGGQEALRAGW
jgi:hypothetical protein